MASRPRFGFFPRVAVVAACLFASSAQATTFVVDTIADDPDANLADGICRTQGLRCSLRAAVEQATNWVGADRIEFAIAGPGPHRIVANGGLPLITEDLAIDGYSQPGARANALAVGSDALLDIEIVTLDTANLATGIGVVSGRLTLSGLVLRGFSVCVRFDPAFGSVAGSSLKGSRIEGCPTGVLVQGSGVVIGGVSLAARNHLSSNPIVAVSLEGHGNFVTNNLIGTDASGTFQQPNGFGVTLISGRDHVITDNVISGNGTGVSISAAVGTSTLVRNRIGTRADGTGAIRNATGIEIAGGSNQIGLPSATLANANLISGNTIGLRITGFANRVQGNYFGTGANGVGAIPNNQAIVIEGGDLNTIGAPAGVRPSGEGNVIAFSRSRGITLPTPASVPPESIYNSLRGNRLYGNQALDIDLAGDFAANDDLGDLDAGPNNLQNTPVISAVRVTQGLTEIDVTLDSEPGSYDIDFYSSASCDAAPDPGVGEFYLGSSPTIDLPANPRIIVGLATTAQGRGFTAMATDVSGNSSQLGPCFETAVTNGADLQLHVVRQGSPGVDPGEVTQFEVKVENRGPADATNVPIAILRPQAFSSWRRVVSLGSFDANTGVWSLPLIRPNEVFTLLIEANVATNAFGAFVVDASATQGLSEVDPNLLTNHADLALFVRTGADLVVTQTAPVSAAPGAVVSLDLSVRNAGPEDAIGVTASGQLDAGLTPVLAPTGFALDPATRRWTLPLGDLAVGAAAPFVLEASVETPAPGLFSTQHSFTASARQPLDPSPTLATSIVGVPATADAFVGYQTVGNQGPDSLTGFTLTIACTGSGRIGLQAPSPTEPPPHLVPSATCPSGAQPRIQCPLVCEFSDTLAAGEETGNILFGGVTSGRIIRTVSGPAFDPELGDNQYVFSPRTVLPSLCGLLGIEFPLILGVAGLLRGAKGRRWLRRRFGVGSSALLACLTLAAAAPELARAAPPTLAVDSAASNASVAITSSLGSPPPRAIALSGSLDVDVALASDALFGPVAQSLQLTGGAIALSNDSIVLESVPLYDLTFSWSGIAVSAAGPAASGFAVAPGVSLFDLVGSSLSFGGGSIAATGTFFGLPVSETLDLGTLPFGGAFPANSIARVEVTDLGGGVTAVRLALPFAATVRLMIDTEPVTVTIAGTLAFAGQRVPEPSAVLLLGIAGALGLAAWHNRASSRTAPR
ncbi:MAG TPA: NosD domain-containing protein [Myxococcota bacterium]